MSSFCWNLIIWRAIEHARGSIFLRLYFFIRAHFCRCYLLRRKEHQSRCRRDFQWRWTKGIIYNDVAFIYIYRHIVWFSASHYFSVLYSAYYNNAECASREERKVIKDVILILNYNFYTSTSFRVFCLLQNFGCRRARMVINLCL